MISVVGEVVHVEDVLRVVIILWIMFARDRVLSRRSGRRRILIARPNNPAHRRAAYTKERHLRCAERQSGR